MGLGYPADVEDCVVERGVMGVGLVVLEGGVDVDDLLLLLLVLRWCFGIASAFIVASLKFHLIVVGFLGCPRPTGNSALRGGHCFVEDSWSGLVGDNARCWSRGRIASVETVLSGERGWMETCRENVTLCIRSAKERSKDRPSQRGEKESEANT